MSWTASRKARRFAADGEIAAMFREVKRQLDNPVGQRIVRLHEEATKEFMANTPIDGDVEVATYGHFDNDGHGNATLRFSITPHAKPAVPVVVATESEPEPFTPPELRAPAPLEVAPE